VQVLVEDARETLDGAVLLVHEVLVEELGPRRSRGRIAREQQEEAMVAAVGALAAVGGREALPILERLAEGDPSLKVRQAAITARKAVTSAR
jgi:hypothetical protein